MINEYGIHIIRFTNEQVLEEPEAVLKNIAAASPPSPLQHGEGPGLRNRNTVLMLDARKIYRKVTSKVNDFSPEQLQNLICIVGLYRGNTKKFKETISGYLTQSANLAKETAEILTSLKDHFAHTYSTVMDFAARISKVQPGARKWMEALNLEGLKELETQQQELVNAAKKAKADQTTMEGIAQLCKALRKPQDKLLKQFFDTITTANKEYQLGKNKEWKDLGIKEKLELLKELQQQLSGNPEEEEPGLLYETEYCHKQAHWLTSRFPEGVYTNVEGLCKVVTLEEIEAKDWSLSPGRYVGVDTSTDEDFDYEERLNEIHIELEGLNEEAMALTKTIAENYKGLEI